MRATHSQMSKIHRKKQLSSKVLRIRERSLLLMLAKRGRFRIEELNKFSARIGKQFNINTNVVMCDDTGGADIEFLGIEVVK